MPKRSAGSGMEGCAIRVAARSFCASSILLTGKYKQKPAEKVLAEIMRQRKNPDLMMACFERIRSQEVLEAIARDRAYNVTARRIAINMFADQNLLVDK